MRKRRNTNGVTKADMKKLQQVLKAAMDNDGDEETLKQAFFVIHSMGIPLAPFLKKESTYYVQYLQEVLHDSIHEWVLTAATEAWESELERITTDVTKKSLAFLKKHAPWIDASKMASQDALVYTWIGDVVQDRQRHYLQTLFYRDPQGFTLKDVPKFIVKDEEITLLPDEG
jgi:hypothetical protein